MSGKTIGQSLGYGFAGNYARLPDMVIGTMAVAKDADTIPYGGTVFLNGTGAATGYQDGMTAKDFVGIAVSEIKTGTTYGKMEGEYNPGDAVPVLKRGAVSVLCHVGTPMPGGAVYLRIAENNAVAGSVVGCLEAQADGSNTVQLENAVWATGMDASGMAELLLKTINLI